MVLAILYQEQIRVEVMMGRLYARFQANLL